MADLDDLGYTSLTDMDTDESIELLRQIRLSRRIPVKKVKKTSTRKPKAAPKPSADQAAELLKILTGGK